MIEGGLSDSPAGQAQQLAEALGLSAAGRV
jgi:hypothetical protein